MHDDARHGTICRSVRVRAGGEMADRAAPFLRNVRAAQIGEQRLAGAALQIVGVEPVAAVAVYAEQQRGSICSSPLLSVP